jgi:hypothetical protein
VRGNCSSPVELLKPGGVCVSVELPNLMDSLSFFLWNLSLVVTGAVLGFTMRGSLCVAFRVSWDWKCLNWSIVSFSPRGCKSFGCREFRKTDSHLVDTLALRVELGF